MAATRLNEKFMLMSAALMRLPDPNGSACTCVSLRGLAVTPATRNIEENVFQRFAAIACKQARRCIVVLDTASLHDDDALAQTLYFAHVVRSQQHGRLLFGAVLLEARAHPI